MAALLYFHTFPSMTNDVVIYYKANWPIKHVLHPSPKYGLHSTYSKRCSSNKAKYILKAYTIPLPEDSPYILIF